MYLFQGDLEAAIFIRQLPVDPLHRAESCSAFRSDFHLFGDLVRCHHLSVYQQSQITRRPVADLCRGALRACYVELVVLEASEILDVLLQLEVFERHILVLHAVLGAGGVVACLVKHVWFF